MSAIGAPNTTVVTISEPIGPGGFCLGRDTLGKEQRIRADQRPKGVPAPALGERWVICKQGTTWLLDRMLDPPDPPAIQGVLDPTSALGSLVAGLDAAGMVQDATTAPPAPVAPPWTGLALGTGWAAYTTLVDGLAPPTPAWSASGLPAALVVRLRGLVTNAAAISAGAVLATLPAAARPPSIRAGLLLPDLATSATAFVRVDVKPNGQAITPFDVAADRVLSLEQATWTTW